MFFGPLTGVFPAGQTSRTICVPIIADTLDERSEIFKLIFSTAKTEEIPNNKTYVIGADSIPASIYAEGIQSGTAIVTAKVTDSDGDEYKSDEVRVSVLKIQKILEVDYFGNHPLVSDPNSQGQTTSYTALPEWNDHDQNGTAGDSDGERRYPVVYTRNNVLKLETAKIKADLTGLDAGSLDQIMVRATANHNGITIPATEATVTGDEIKITNVTAESNGRFHNKVDYLPSFQLAWEVSLDKGANWIDAGTSSSPVYLTHKAPQTSPLYHTLVHIGSTNGKNATDQNNEGKVVDAIWD